MSFVITNSQLLSSMYCDFFVEDLLQQIIWRICGFWLVSLHTETICDAKLWTGKRNFLPRFRILGTSTLPTSLAYPSVETIVYCGVDVLVFRYTLQEENSILPFSTFPLERIAYWPAVHRTFWSVTKFFKWNIQWLAKYQKISYIGFGGNNIAKFIDYQI